MRWPRPLALNGETKCQVSTLFGWRSARRKRRTQERALRSPQNTYLAFAHVSLISTEPLGESAKAALKKDRERKPWFGRERPHPLTHQASREFVGSLPHQSRVARDTLGRVQDFERASNPQEERKMPYIKKPPELVSRSIKLEQPVSELLDDYSRFVECTPDHVANYVLKKLSTR